MQNSYDLRMSIKVESHLLLIRNDNIIITDNSNNPNIATGCPVPKRDEIP